MPPYLWTKQPSLTSLEVSVTHKLNVLTGEVPLSEGQLAGSTVTCPWHGAQFNVCTGAVLKGPAADSLKTFRVVVEGEIGRVDAT